VLGATNQDLPVTQQLLGHKSIATTGIYVKADMGQRLRAVMAMPLMFDGKGFGRR
jgi:site-specific recombinase XerD